MLSGPGPNSSVWKAVTWYKLLKVGLQKRICGVWSPLTSIWTRISKLKTRRKRWSSFYKISCWGPTTWDIGISVSYSPLSRSNPNWVLTSLENMLVMKNAPLWVKPSTSPFEAVLLAAVNSRKTSRAVLSRPLPGMRRWAVQIWDTKRLWHYFISIAEVSILGSLLLLPPDKFWILFQVPLFLPIPMSHNCLLGHWKDTSLRIILKCNKGEVSSAPFTS